MRQIDIQFLQLVSKREYDKVDELLNSKDDHLPNIDVQKETGNTALHLAVINKDLDMVKLLIGKGINPLIANIKKLRPLDLIDVNDTLMEDMRTVCKDAQFLAIKTICEAIIKSYDDIIRCDKSLNIVSKNKLLLGVSTFFSLINLSTCLYSNSPVRYYSNSNSIVLIIQPNNFISS